MFRRSRDGRLWLATSRGLVEVRDGRARLVWQNGARNARSIFEDEEGTLWVATDGGIVRVRGESVVTFTTKEGLPLDAISVVLADRQAGIWASSGRGIFRVARAELE